MTSLERLALHTATTRPWSLAQAVDGYARAGVLGITVWREHIDAVGAARARVLVRDAGLTPVAVCRGGFFVADAAAERTAAIDDTRRAIGDAAAIGAPVLVLVCGASPKLPLADQRLMIADAICALAPEAAGAGIRLAVEPLHPMYVADRSAIVTLRQARELCDAASSPVVGIALDVYHVFWDPDLYDEIRRCAALLTSLHLSDFRVPTRDLLNDRGLMGTGCIPIRSICDRVRHAGFAGWDEVEIFSHELWAMDQAEVVSAVVKAYRAHCL
jgi:sugar phosphate isomerase/epimerase